MSVSVGKITAGSGYEYLVKQVASGAEDYYAGAGEEPGQWHGAAHLLGLNGEVTEEQMHSVFGLAETLEGEPIGNRFAVYAELFQRIEDDIADAGGLSVRDRIVLRTNELAAAKAEERKADVAGVFARAGGVDAETVAEIVRVQSAKPQRAAVAGFDVTFSPQKSVSLVWGLTEDHRVKAAIETAHKNAVDAAFQVLDREVAVRAGRNGVRRLDHDGLIVARFKHRTSRESDPQIHTHCAVLNRARSTEDGVWRALDGNDVYALSGRLDGIYHAHLEAELSRTLDIEWTLSDGKRSPEIAGIDQALIDTFSKRRQQISATVERQADAVEARTGRHLTDAARKRIERVAVLSTRRAKESEPVTEHFLRNNWRREARKAGHSLRPISRIKAHASTIQPEAPSLDADVVDAIANAVVAHLEHSRSTWNSPAVRRVAADRLRDNNGQRIFDTVEQIEAAIDQIETAVFNAGQVQLTFPPPRLGHRALGDNTAEYDAPRHRIRYSSRRILDAETDILHTSRTSGAPRIAGTEINTDGLSPDQAAAVTGIATSGQAIDLLIGPPGAGKTHTMGALTRAWQAQGGDVIGITVSQVAAQELASATGTRCENAAKWRHSRSITGYDHSRWDFRRHQLVIIDEASMMPTLILHDLVKQARTAQAKVLLVGDPHQLGSPEAGGTFRLLAADNTGYQLTEIRRFKNEWERDATIQLRNGDADVVDTYDLHGRLHGGTEQQMMNAARDAWIHDRENGLKAIMITTTNEQAAELSATESPWVRWRLSTLETRMEPCRRTRHRGSRPLVGIRHRRRPRQCGWFASCGPS